MGWTYYRNPPVDEKAEIERLHKPHKVLALRKVGSIWFSAFEPEDQPGEVLIGVILTRRYRGEWGYKAMEETMGPAEPYCRCPESILKMASEPKNEYARRFRERCWAWHNRIEPKPGDTIRTPQPLSFTSGSYDTFVKASERNVYWTPIHTRVRIPPRYIAGAKIIAHVAG